MSEAMPPFRAPAAGDRPSLSDPTFQDWTAVPLPEDWTAPANPGRPPKGHATDPQAEREAELLDLIRDLNRCNEALLSRVHQLEQSLEATQQALQTEVEQGGRSDNGPDPMAIAQQRSLAQLLQELETTNDALKRQRILSETLQGQLTASQERVQELEGEVGRLQQRHGEQSQALLQAEETIRDLRSRLQRQQRYTLQFKAALEKCLDVAPSANSGVSLGDPSSAPVPTATPSGRGMPRAHRIQPWSLWEGDTPPLDPHLRAFLQTPTPGPQSMAELGVTELGNPATTSAVPESSDDPLWRDLEAVIEQSLEPPATAAPHASRSETPVTSAPTADPAPSPEPPATPLTSLGNLSRDARPAVEPAFTEPSPWGPPRPTSTPEPVVTVSTPGHSTPSQPAPFLPVGNQSPSPSPLVHPLRPPKKKRTSLSAVELPQFPRPARP